LILDPFDFAYGNQVAFLLGDATGDPILENPRFNPVVDRLVAHADVRGGLLWGHHLLFVERLWRTVKYEDIYVKEYATVQQLDAGLADYFRFYNHKWLQQSLAYRTPAEVHFA